MNIEMSTISNCTCTNVQQEKVVNNDIQKTRYHFIGIGGGGTSALHNVYFRDVEGTYTCINTHTYKNDESKKWSTQFNYFYWNKNIVNIENWKKLKKNLMLNTGFYTGENDHYIVFVGLGGFAGTNISKVVQYFLEKDNKEYTVICMVPFANEGSERATIAANYIEKVKNNPNFRFIYADRCRMKYMRIDTKASLYWLDDEAYIAFLSEHNPSFEKKQYGVRE